MITKSFVKAMLGVAFTCTVFAAGFLCGKKSNDAVIEAYCRYYNAAEAVLDEVNDYIWNKYNECLTDTIWEGDTYAIYSETYKNINK